MIDRRDLFRFRAYTDSFTGKYRMVYNVESTYDDGCNGVLMSGRCFGDIAESHKEHNLMLCTGIKDSKGKLIYENDIIEIEYIFNRKIKYQVKYGEYTHYLRPHTNIGFYMQDLKDNTTWSFEVASSSTTIVGNIYETKEFMHLQATNELPSDKFMQSMIDNYSDNDEHSDGSIEEAYKQFNDLIKEN